MQFSISIVFFFYLLTVKCQKQFYLKQFGLAYKNSSISNSSVQHKYTVLYYLTHRRTPSGATTLGQSESGSDDN